ncbi:TPA: LysR family transcriptional regulator [Klebsiella quasipneumoniae subsp. similipneumoniae]|nr:LysR family transcriptional regulator [Klebsiella quasipneumoniae subsp. similipneumoniae]
MRVNLEGISVFVEAAERRSFAEAAVHLSLTRSAVGKTIARLESRLGVRLFHRTTRTQQLTEQGRIYYERCLRALAELTAGESLLESGHNEVRGKVSVSMPLLFGRYCAAPVLMKLSQQYPRLELDMSFSDRMVDVINEGFDLAIRFDAAGTFGSLQSRKIASQRKVLCASPEFLTKNGLPEKPEDISDWEALIYRNRGNVQSWDFYDENNELRELKLNGRLRFDNLDAISDAAVRGMGIACLPRWLIGEQVRNGKLTVLFDDLRSPLYDTYAVWPESQYIPLKISIVIDALTAELAWVSAE